MSVSYVAVAAACRASVVVQITPAADADEHGLFDRWLFLRAPLELQCRATVRRRHEYSSTSLPPSLPSARCEYSSTPLEGAA